MKKILALLLIGLSFVGFVASQPAPDGPAKVKKHRGLKRTPKHILAAAHKFQPKAWGPSSYWRFPKKLSTWGNNQYGDCVSAESAFCKACSGIFIPESEVIRWARQNGVLDGADLQQVIDLQRADGFHGDGNVYGNGPGSTVNYADAPTFKAAIYKAGLDKGCISIGISADMLPSGAGNDMGWFKSGPTNDNSEDHCVSICGYGTAAEFCVAIKGAYGVDVTPPATISATTQGYALYTWNTIGFVETSSCVGMMGEAWIRNPSTIITGTGTPTPDEVYVGGDPLPPPGPPPVPPPTPVPPGTIPTITLGQDIKAGSYQVVPTGTIEAVADAATAMNNLAKLLQPTGPTPAPGTLNQRVDAIEAKMTTIDTSLNRLADSVIQLQKLIQGQK